MACDEEQGFRAYQMTWKFSCKRKSNRYNIYGLLFMIVSTKSGHNNGVIGRLERPVGCWLYICGNKYKTMSGDKL